MTAYTQGHPIQRPDQSFASHQSEMANWMGAPSVAEMNRVHDPLHAELSQWMGATSYSLLLAQGVDLPPNLRRLAELEEVAVLHTQRWLQHLHNEEVDVWARF